MLCQPCMSRIWIYPIFRERQSLLWISSILAQWVSRYPETCSYCIHFPFHRPVNGANLIITTRRSSNAGQQHAAFGLCRPKEMCANPLTDVQTLLSALNLTVQTNASHGRNNLGEVRDSDWNTSNAEADKPCHDISLPTVELRPKKPKGSKLKAANCRSLDRSNKALLCYN